MSRTARTSPAMLHLAEVFGPTWQGEGPYAGRRCGFVRLGLCNLSCDWCDTAYTWDRDHYNLDVEAPLTDTADVLAQVDRIEERLWILTGGEPLIHHHALLELLGPGDRSWHVETNGTIIPPDWWTAYVEHTSVSPKVGTRDPEHRRIKPKALQYWATLAWAGLACFKFVAATPSDLDHIERIVVDHNLPREQVWVMPEGRTADAVVRHHRALAHWIMQAGFNTTTRLHVLLYDDERGR